MRIEVEGYVWVAAKTSYSFCRSGRGRGGRAEAAAPLLAQSEQAETRARA